MMDVTNPGLVNVSDEAEGNPDPNGGTAKATPRETGVLTGVADDGSPLVPGGGAQADVFPTPSDVTVGFPAPSVPVQVTPVPAATEVDVAAQSIGQGGMVPVDPADPAAGFEFSSPAEFVVVGPAESFQTNQTTEDVVDVTVVAVYDADNLFFAPGPNTTRYYLRTAAPALTSYPVSLLGRQVTFSDASSNPGATRAISNYGANFLVINRDDQSEDNGNVPALLPPGPGDVLEVDVGRRGSEQVNTGGETINVTIDGVLPPPAAVLAPPQGSSGTFDVSTGPQPQPAPPASGTRVSSSVTVEVADQCRVVGLPTNVFV
jgi:hypothetical protein